MKKTFILFSILFAVSLSSFAQADEEYSNTLKKMFAVSGSEGTYQVAIKQMFSIFKQQYADVDEAMWTDLEKEFSQTSINDLTEMLVPVYYKQLTQEDLEELIAFYQTAVGKKFAKSTPFIMQESMQVGQQWGMKIGEDFEKKMKEKGY